MNALGAEIASMTNMTAMASAMNAVKNVVVRERFFKIVFVPAMRTKQTARRIVVVIVNTGPLYVHRVHMTVACQQGCLLVGYGLHVVHPRGCIGG